MSVDLYFIIEVKDADGKWHLVKHFSNSVLDGYGSDIDKKVEIDGEEYDVNIEKWTGLGWRDELSYGGLLSHDYTSNGLPEDISDELKAIVEKDRVKEEENLKKWYGDDYNKDMYYRKFSYLYLSEMYEMFEKKLEDWKKGLRERVFNTQMDVISKRLDKIEKLVRGKEVKETRKAKTDEEYYEESVEYELDEDLWDVLSLYRELGELSGIIKDYTGQAFFSNENVRIIYYVE